MWLCCAVLSRSVCVRLFVNPWTVAHQTPLSMGILQARILGWVARSSSRGSSQPRDGTEVPCIADGFFTIWATREAQINVEPVSNGCSTLFKYTLVFPWLTFSTIFNNFVNFFPCLKISDLPQLFHTWQVVFPANF